MQKKKKRTSEAGNMDKELTTQGLCYQHLQNASIDKINLVLDLHEIIGIGKWYQVQHRPSLLSSVETLKLFLIVYIVSSVFCDSYIFIPFAYTIIGHSSIQKKYSRVIPMHCIVFVHHLTKSFFNETVCIIFPSIYYRGLQNTENHSALD